MIYSIDPRRWILPALVEKLTATASGAGDKLNYEMMKSWPNHSESFEVIIEKLKISENFFLEKIFLIFFVQFFSLQGGAKKKCTLNKTIKYDEVYLHFIDEHILVKLNNIKLDPIIIVLFKWWIFCSWHKISLD